MDTGEFLAQHWPTVAIIFLVIMVLLILFWPEKDYPTPQKSIKMNSVSNIWPFSRSSSKDEVTQTVPMKRYIQLQDSHIAKKGMVWEASIQNYNLYVPVTLDLMNVSEPSQWREPKRSIEGNVGWFEELIPVYVNKDMMQSINSLALKSGK